MPHSTHYHTLASLLRHWFARSARALPWRATRDPYKVLISEFMLQQTQVITVIPYFVRWIQLFPDFASLAKADEQSVLRAWEGLGYYSRARNLHRTAKEVLQRHHGRLPADTQSIRSLPGIGPYTAGAIASFAFDLPEPAIDANVQRVLARIFNIRDEISSKAAKAALNEHARRLLAAATPSHGAINAAIMELGALVCTSGKPECHRCPVNSHCTNSGKGTDLPIKRPKPKPTRLEEFALWDITPKGVLLELRRGPRWRSLWTLPETAPSPTHLFAQRFAVTRYQISLHIVANGTPTAKYRNNGGPGLQRFPLSDLDTLPLAAPHRRALDHMLNQLNITPPPPLSQA